MRIVSYIRVSTTRQGASGLGIEAQRAEIAAYAATQNAEVTAEFVEIESGKKNDRPELARAIREARLTGAKLVIARLNRLSRNAAFLLNLRDSGVDFVAADMPNANSMTVGVMALVAQEEREAISRNTKAALRAAKARGQRLGNPNGAAALRRADRGNTDAVEAVKARADARAHAIVDVLEELERRGFTTLQAIADELNRRGIETPRKGRWHVTSVARLKQRLAEAV